MEGNHLFSMPLVMKQKGVNQLGAENFLTEGKLKILA